MRKSVPTIAYRRKRQQKTNYRKRIGLLKSGKSRLVIRKSNKYVTIQVVKYEATGDKIIKSVNSKELSALGWKFSCVNVPACYLAGLLLASKMKDEKDKTCIVDFGLQIPLKGKSRSYSALKGCVDGNLDIAVGENIFPTEDQLLGKKHSEEMQKSIADIKAKLLA